MFMVWQLKVLTSYIIESSTYMVITELKASVYIEYPEHISGQLYQSTSAPGHGCVCLMINITVLCIENNVLLELQSKWKLCAVGFVLIFQ